MALMYMYAVWCEKELKGIHRFLFKLLGIRIVNHFKQPRLKGLLTSDMGISYPVEIEFITAKGKEYEHMLLLHFPKNAICTDCLIAIDSVRDLPPV